MTRRIVLFSACLHRHRHNLGAMFGIDARIALAIFAAVSISVGAITVGNLGSIYGQALADELNTVSLAVEGFHSDVQKDIFKTIGEPDETKAFMALYDPAVLKSSRDRARWLGPYLQHHTTQHTRYGQLQLTKRAETITNRCGSGCFLWLTLSKVPPEVVDSVNDIFDHGISGDAQYTGRIQWETCASETCTLWYRVGRAQQ